MTANNFPPGTCALALNEKPRLCPIHAYNPLAAKPRGTFALCAELDFCFSALSQCLIVPSMISETLSNYLVRIQCTFAIPLKFIHHVQTILTCHLHSSQNRLLKSVTVDVFYFTEKYNMPVSNQPRNG